MAKDKQYGPPTLPREAPAKKTTLAPVVPIAKTPTRPVVAEPSARQPVHQVAALPFGRQNYVLMLAGIGLVLAGFFIMSLDKAEFGFGFLGLTLGPVVVMGGFVLEFFAILARPKV